MNAHFRSPERPTPDDLPTFQFGRFTLDTGRGVLMADGIERPLRAKSFALLRLLAEKADGVVGPDEIMRRIWAGVTVGEAVIAQSIRDIRRALGDDGQQLIRTVPRQGYRLVGPVRRSDPAQLEGGGPQLIRLPVPRTGRPVLLVLPFSNLAPDDTQAYFAAGLTADLVTDIARCEDLHVITPRRRHDGELDDAVARRADFVLEGGVQRSDDRIRVTARLSERASARVIWSERFDRPIDDLFAIQSDLSGLIAFSVDTEIERELLQRSREKAPGSLTAYDLFLQGRDLFGRVTADTAAMARDLFDRAIAIDPTYAPSYAYQSFIALRGFTLDWGDIQGPAALEPALELSERAFALAPRSPLTNMRRAFVLSVLSRDDEAIESGACGVRLNTGNAESRATYGEILSRGGHHAEGAAELRLAMSLDPYHNPVWHAAAGRALLFAGQAVAGVSELRRAAALAPDYVPSHTSLLVAYFEGGHMDEARASLKKTLRLKPRLNIGNLRHGLRRKEDAERFAAACRAVGMPEN